MIGRAISGLSFAFVLTAVPAYGSAMDGIASVYGLKGDKHAGARTASGERVNPQALTDGSERLARN